MRFSSWLACFRANHRRIRTRREVGRRLESARGGTAIERLECRCVPTATVASFPVPLTAVAPMGSLVYEGQTTGSIAAAGDTSDFTISLDAGQRVTLLVTPDTTLQPSVRLLSPTSQTLAANTATAAGSRALLNTVQASQAGDYTIRVSASGSNVGSFTLQLLLNSALETEIAGTSSNGTTATAQSLTTAFQSISTGSVASVNGVADGNATTLPTEIEPNENISMANSAVNNFVPYVGSRYQMSIDGSIQFSREGDFYNIGQLQAGDVLTVSMAAATGGRGTNFDTYIELYSNNGVTLIDSDDDGGAGGVGDSLIFRTTITSTDTYYLKARSFSSGTGTYQLGLLLENLGTPPNTGGALTTESEPNDTAATANDFSTSWRPIQYESTTTGIVAGLDYFEYQFEAGDVITVHATATPVSSVDLRLRLYDVSGSLLAFEDGQSFGPGQDSWIFGYSIPASGRYFVEVGGFFSSGGYQLDVDLSSNTPPPSSSGVYDSYSFNLQAGQHLTMAVEALTAGNVDVRLVNAGGTVLATSTTSATNVDAAVVDFVATTAGTYYAQVTGDDTTQYNLTVLRGATFDLEANDTSATAQTGVLLIPVLGAISGDEDWYSYSLNSGDIVVLSTRTPADGVGEFVNVLDPRLELYDPTDTLVLSDDNSAADGRNVLVSFTAASTGTYRVRVLGTGDGEYVLRVAPAPRVTLSLSNSSFDENGGTSTLTATLSGASDLDVSLQLAYTGSANIGQDFQGLINLTIPAGQLTGTFDLTGIADLRDEDDETITIDLASVTNGIEQTPQQVTATILDDDLTPTLTLAVSQAVIAEDSGTATITLTSSAISDRDITVGLAITGNASNGTDYTISTVTLLLPAGQTVVSAQISGLPDTTPESHETVIIDLDTAINGVEATPQQVTVILADNDHNPVANADSVLVVEGGTATTLVGGATTLLANDVDGDLPYDTLTVQTPALVGPAHGSLILNADGTFTYSHDGSENFTDQFSYRVLDSDGGVTSTATVTITIAPVNDNLPVAGTDFINVDEGGQATLLIGGGTSLFTNDTDPDLPNDVLTFDPVPVVVPAHGSVTLNANGTFLYIHDGSEASTDSFQYRIVDEVGHFGIGTVSISVNPINDPPIARPDTIQLFEGGSATSLTNGASTVLANDSDAEVPNSSLTLTLVNSTIHGTLTLNPDGTFLYQHDGSETQTDSFTYQLKDPQNATGQTTVQIRIVAVIDNSPVAVNDSVNVLQGGTALTLVGGAVSVAYNDLDTDLPFDSFTVIQVAGPSHGTLTLNADGSFFYTNDDTRNATDSFTYKLKDGAGNESNTATVNISVKLVNEQPTANAGGPYAVAPGTDLNLNGTATVDPDGDTLTYRWDIKGDGVIDVVSTSPTAVVPWTTLVSLGLVSGVTPVRLEVRDPSGRSSTASTTLTIGSVYTFNAATDGVADDYVVSTIAGTLDIRKAGTSTNLAAIGLTAITGVNIVGSSDDETFLVQQPSRTLSLTIDGNGGNDAVKVQGTALADVFNIASNSGRVVVSKTPGIPFSVSATGEVVAVLAADGNDILDARQVTAALTSLQLFGEGGNDTLGGGLGDDSFVGGDGTDLLSEVGPGNVALTNSQLTGHGTDAVDATIEAIKLTGDASGNLLDASAFTRFSVTLDGAAGNDTLMGGLKADTLVGGADVDEVRQAVTGNATVSNSQLILGTAPSTVTDSLSSIEKVKLTGSAIANKFTATSFSGSATLEGAAGNDTLLGGIGADLILGGSENDSLLGGGGNDTIGGGTGNDIIDGGDGNDGLAGQDGNDTLKGGNGNDTLLGQAGDDSLRGAAGRDLIQGGLGKDNINGEGDTDTVMGGSGGGADRGDKIFDPFGEVLESFRFTVDWLSLI